MAIATFFGSTFGNIHSWNPAIDAARDLVRNGPGRFGEISRQDLATTLVTDEDDFISDRDARDVSYIERRPVHRDPAGDRDVSRANDRTTDVRERTTVAVLIADRDGRDH